MRGQRVPIGDEEKTFVFLLELQPILEGAEIMAQMEPARGPHAAQHSFALRHPEKTPPPAKMGLQERKNVKVMLAQSAQVDSLELKAERAARDALDRQARAAIVS
jgi:hypothetical protein